MFLKYGNGCIPKEVFDRSCKQLQIIPPKSFWEVVHLDDGGAPTINLFQFISQDNNKKEFNCLGRFLSFLSLDYDNIVKLNTDPPEFFPRDLVAFAEDGGGNLICFDYREGKDNPNPPIVFWDHEADIGKDVSFVAKDFETFIGMLRSDEELDK